MRNSLLTTLLFISAAAFSQKVPERKLVLVTFDGYRWEDAFKGADSAKFFAKIKGAKDSALQVQKFWGADQQQRRMQLMPFVWGTIGTKGQIYGNRQIGSNANVKNPYWFSYPGYNEILTGAPDIAINSNDYKPNPNITLPEYLNKLPGFQDKVAAFTSWAAFNNILNKERCGFPVNAGYTVFDMGATERQKALSDVQFLLPKVFGNNERPDAITYYLAKEYMMKNHPRFLQVSFIETDAYGHRDEYALYLASARNNDQMIEDLWNTLQKDPYYKDQTTLVIATDHGRGDNAIDNWTHHNSKTPGSDQVWFAVMGPWTKSLGEIKNMQIYQYQYANTMAALLGITFKSPVATGPAIETAIK